MGVVEEGKSGSRDDNQQYQNQYGTFQGVANNQHPPPPPPPLPPHQSYQHQQQEQQHQQYVIGIPKAAPPLGATPYAYGYQGIPVQGYADGRPVREHRLPCCGLGLGWWLFITGFFLGFIPWYIGALVLLCARVDHREKPGYVACMIGTILSLIAISLGVTKQNHAW